MNVRNLIATALRSLAKNKMRSSLTSLGIIIGVASVIMMVGIGNSARVTVREKVVTFGANAMALTSKKAFTERDVEKIRRSVPSVRYITPIVSSSNISLKYQNKYLKSRISGVNNDFFKIREWALQEGRYFTDTDVLAVEKLALIGNTVKMELFGYTNPIGKLILVNNVPMIVIGSLEEMGQAFSGRDQDNIIIIPFTTASLKVEGKREFEEIFISAYSEDMVDKTADDLKSFMRQERALLPGQPDNFRISTSKEKLEMAEYLSKTLSILLAGIASISLIVGGIGIMNIMLVSVSERTREIGIRMAIGAKKRDILLQFLIESVTLSTVGGIAGMIIGLVLYFVITTVVDWPFLFSFFSVFLSFFFSCAVGVFFGYYPSRKASDLKPIDALRFE